MPTLASHAFLKSVHLAKNWRATCYRPCCCVLPAVERKRRCHTTVFHPNCPRPLSCWKEVEEPEAMAKTETQNKFPSHLSQRSSKRETEQVSAGTKDPIHRETRSTKLGFGCSVRDVFLYWFCPGEGKGVGKRGERSRAGNETLWLHRQIIPYFNLLRLHPPVPGEIPISVIRESVRRKEKRDGAGENWLCQQRSVRHQPAASSMAGVFIVPQLRVVHISLLHLWLSLPLRTDENMRLF